MPPKKKARKVFGRRGGGGRRNLPAFDDDFLDDFPDDDFDDLDDFGLDMCPGMGMGLDSPGMDLGIGSSLGPGGLVGMPGAHELPDGGDPGDPERLNRLLEEFGLGPGDDGEEMMDPLDYLDAFPGRGGGLFPRRRRRRFVNPFGRLKLRSLRPPWARDFPPDDAAADFAEHFVPASSSGARSSTDPAPPECRASALGPASSRQSTQASTGSLETTDASSQAGAPQQEPSKSVSLAPGDSPGAAQDSAGPAASSRNGVAAATPAEAPPAPAATPPAPAASTADAPPALAATPAVAPPAPAISKAEAPPAPDATSAETPPAPAAVPAEPAQAFVQVSSTPVTFGPPAALGPSMEGPTGPPVALGPQQPTHAAPQASTVSATARAQDTAEAPTTSLVPTRLISDADDVVLAPVNTQPGADTDEAQLVPASTEAPVVVAAEPEQELPPPSPPKAKKVRRRVAQELPQDFPQLPRSAYALFCKEFSEQARQARLDALPAPPSPDSDIPLLELLERNQKKAGKKRKAAAKPKAKALAKGEPSFLTTMKQSWDALDVEQRRKYDILEMEEKDRFTKDFQIWREAQTGKESLTDAEKLMAKSGFIRPGVFKGINTRLSASAAREGTMDELICGIYVRGLDEAKVQRQEKKQTEAEAKARQKLPGHGPGVPIESVGESAEPEDTVDDLLDFGVEGEQEDGQGSDLDGSASAHGSEAPLPWNMLPGPSASSRHRGPQMRYDDEGNLVLDESTLTMQMGEDVPLDDMDGPVHEHLTQFDGAYKRTPRCKWTDAETAKFYEALSLYGSNLLFVQTFFRTKSVAQIKTKYDTELKRNPQKVDEFMRVRRKKLTKDAFEKEHGKIDTSTHYVPPPTPPPGQPSEAEEKGGGFGGFGSFSEETGSEPEYTADDENETTNRLMALFGD